MWWIYFVLFADTFASPAMDQPDFVSTWTMMEAGRGASYPSYMVFSHGLGEMPLLVDVQVKSVEEPNTDFIFPGVGSCIRDDDKPTLFGNVCYLYNDTEVLVAFPRSMNENDAGMAIYAVSDTYFAGPNNQTSWKALVRVRAWRHRSLPPPDYVIKGLGVVAKSPNQSDVYKEVKHNLSSYPSLVIVRVQLGDRSYAGYMSDALGSNPVFQRSLRRQNYAGVAFGFDEQTIRVWIPSHRRTRTYVWTASDGHAFPNDAKASTGDVEIYAWKFSTFTPAIVQATTLGYGLSNEVLNMPFVYPGLNFYFTQVWAQARDGANNGFMFKGSGAAGYDTDQDAVCTYGGLTYAYSHNEIRFWRPTNITNGGIICIASASGLGRNAQSSTTANIIMHTWIFNTTLSYPDVQQEEVEDVCFL